MSKFQNQQTFLIVKPDGVQRSLVGDVISRIERIGLKIVALKMVVPNRDQLIRHYNKDDAWYLKKGSNIVQNLTANGRTVEKEPIEYGKEIIEQIVKFMTSGPVVAMVIQGNEAVAVVKKLVGGTEPATSDVGTIRGDYTVDSYEHATVDGRAVRNLIHCSDEVEEAKREIGVWFSDEEIVKYRLVQEQILYDVNLDGILE